MSRWKSSTSGSPAKGSIRRPPLQGGQLARADRRGVGPRLVAAHAAGGLAGHQAGEAVHPLDRQVLVVQGHEQQRPPAGASKKAEPSSSTGTVPSTRSSVKVPRRTQVRSAAELDLLGQDLQHEQLLYVAAADALEVAPAVDVGQHEAARGPVRGSLRQAISFSRGRASTGRDSCTWPSPAQVYSACVRPPASIASACLPRATRKRSADSG